MPECRCPTRCRIFQNFVFNICSTVGNFKPRIIKNSYNLKLRGVIGVECAMCKSLVHCASFFETNYRNVDFIMCEECIMCF